MKRVFLALLLCAGAHAQVSPPQIPLTGTAGSGGNFPLLNAGTISIPSDTDFTVTFPNSTCISCMVTSAVTLTATRNLIMPAGLFIINVCNYTTGGQAIHITGTSGTGTSITPGLCVWVKFDGTNWVLAQIVPGPAVVSFSTGSWPSWLTPSVTSPTFTPQLSVTPSAIPNSALENSSIPINGATCTLGFPCTIGSVSLGGTLSNSNISVSTIVSGAAVSVTGLDGSHQITLNTGSSSGGYLMTVVFTASRGHTSYCTFSPADATSSTGSDVQSAFISSESDSFYDLSIFTTATSATLHWNVSCP